MFSKILLRDRSEARIETRIVAEKIDKDSKDVLRSSEARG